MITDCKHEYMGPFILETSINSKGKEKQYPIWMCETTYGCGYKEDRPDITIYFSEKGSSIVDIADDIRVIRILAFEKGVSCKEALKLLMEASIDNPIEIGIEEFWTESKDT